MTHASLFTGIGGFDLAASRMGWDNVFQCEIDPFCQKVLKHHFPQCELFTDIRTTDFTKYAAGIDILTGGFPCQPFSVAGKRKGTDDNRYLWPEMLRAIREVQPLRVIAENVGGILTMQSGVVFERVCADMEDAGYAVQPFVIPACAVGAPHRRDRVWIVARRTEPGIESLQRRKDGVCESTSSTHAVGHDAGRYGYGETCGPDGENQRKRDVPGNGSALRSCEKRDASDTAGAGLSATPQVGGMERGRPGIDHIGNAWADFPAQSPVCGGDDGISHTLDGITFSKWRNESVKACGNAVVPQVAYQIFKAMETTWSQSSKK